MLCIRWVEGLRDPPHFTKARGAECHRKQVIENMERETGLEPVSPAWEVTRHFNFRHLESAGVGLESTETPGKTAVHRERPLNGVQLECSGAKRETPVQVAM